MSDTPTGRLTDVPGVAVGHWTDPVARTGCTVAIMPPGTVASGEIRGGGPASREFGLLGLTRHVEQIDAVVLSGGSAYGLATADGVVRYLEGQGRGYETRVGRVPIVPTMCVFDLGVGDATVRPGAAQGRRAAAAARQDGHEVGPVGAGTGCTFAKLRGPGHMLPGGLVAASTTVGTGVVACLIAVNAIGMIGGPSFVPDPAAAAVRAGGLSTGPDDDSVGAGENTTIGIIATSARLGKVECRLLAESAHDGLARAIFPTHTRRDGDAFVACATGSDVGDVAAPDGVMDLQVDLLRMATTAVVERAILSLVAAR